MFVMWLSVKLCSVKLSERVVFWRGSRRLMIEVVLSQQRHTQVKHEFLVESHCGCHLLFGRRSLNEEERNKLYNILLNLVKKE